MPRILVTGAGGQLGTELVAALRDRFGPEAVLATDLRDPEEWSSSVGPAQAVDCLDKEALSQAASSHNTTVVYHLAAILSAAGEARPELAYQVNLGGLMNVLGIAKDQGLKVFVPSSIAVFGPGTPPDPAPQDTIMRPTSMYGITKVAGELLADFYHKRFGVDVRGVRYPGLISYTAPPGGGTTDYAVEIFHEAVRHGRYTCFLEPDTRMDMMYMPDALRAIVELMDADGEQLMHRNAYNVGAMHFTPAALAAAIRVHRPDFTIDYRIDPVRQRIADSWPDWMDDRAAREEWGWRPRYDLAGTTREMLEHLEAKLRLAGDR